jgi:hypothetical protein
MLGDSPAAEGKTPFSALRAFTQRTPRRIEEHCDLCAEPIGPQHRHLLNLTNRELLCVCQACTLLFDQTAAGGGTRRLIPTRCLSLTDFELTDAQWESLRIPVNIAFFCYSTTAQRVMALYPSPMGPTESQLVFATWADMERRNPILKQMEPDVEALLVNRARDSKAAFLVPIDLCYQLVGLIRIHWKGISGGQEVWQEIERFFADLRERSKPVGSHDARPEL